jgi:NTP pyrophosphatase (non-canonical NTP hydrolase)
VAGADAAQGKFVISFQWLTEEQSRAITDASTREALAEEIADIAIYALRLADKLEIDVEDAILRKMEKNAQRYPVDEARGNATKYDKRSV